MTQIFSAADARRIAKRRLPKLVFDYIDGAAGDESGKAANRAAFERICLVNRVLSGVESEAHQPPLFGKPVGCAFGISPMAMCALAHPHADQSMARWAANHSAPLGVSTSASTSLERMQELAQGNAWFQLYHGGDLALSEQLVDRARAADYQVLTLTVDVPSVGYRPRELRRGFQAPFKIGPKQFFDFATHPQWAIQTLMAGAPRFANFDSDAPFDRSQSRVGADWDFLARLRQRWPHKLNIKGVCHPEDAKRLRSMGVDSITVSNHGARQLQSTVSGLDALREVRAAVGDDLKVFYDSGIESGEDIIKAYAGGANYVFIGRIALYALAAEGAAGLDALTAMLNTSCQSALTQLACKNLQSLQSHHLSVADKT